MMSAVADQQLLFSRVEPDPLDASSFCRAVAAFRAFGGSTRCEALSLGGETVPVYTNEFWTSAQRAAHRLHEISYRACFKPQLPRFFIERLTRPGDLVYDPFMGRGTTLIEAALMNRRVAGCDVNPLSKVFTAPRLNPPSVEAVRCRLAIIDFTCGGNASDDLHVFYHPTTLKQITALQRYLSVAKETNLFDEVDAWIEMI